MSLDMFCETTSTILLAVGPLLGDGDAPTLQGKRGGGAFNRLVVKPIGH